MRLDLVDAPASCPTINSPGGGESGRRKWSVEMISPPFGVIRLRSVRSSTRRSMSLTRPSTKRAAKPSLIEPPSRGSGEPSAKGSSSGLVQGTASAASTTMIVLLVPSVISWSSTPRPSWNTVAPCTLVATSSDPRLRHHRPHSPGTASEPGPSLARERSARVIRPEASLPSMSFLGHRFYAPPVASIRRARLWLSPAGLGRPPSLRRR